MTIFNKSHHPVEIKKISIRIWSLRDEIEAAIERRMKECEAAGIPLYIDDIKKFYKMRVDSPLNEESNVVELKDKKAEPEEEMNDLMETLGDEVKAEASEKAESSEETPKEASNTLNEAEEILAEQKLKGIEAENPNPFLERPFTRQPPNLDKVSYGFSLLSDMNMESILSFAKDGFLHGQSVVIEFLIPQTFIVSAEVTYCSHYSLRSRIISTTKPDYRVQCKFTFAMPKERENLRNFLKSIEPNIQEKKKAKKEADDDSLRI